MSQFKRRKTKLPHPGPWLGVVTNYLDPARMGSLEVVLAKSTMGSLVLQNETVIVRQMTPFYGVSSIAYEGTNSSDFEDVQKSYGMWFVPPDVGTTVICMFIDGEPNDGYWLGCIPATFQNHMVPGIAASQNVSITAEQERKYGTRNLPVAEFLKKGRDLSNPRPDSFNKPIHPFADRLLAQGLLTDTIRGITSSSARREIPSKVFGISTPGPIDPASKKGYVGYSTVATAPTSRLGGTTFVMDDGDKDGQNELVRIRTRTGHQILLHNSHDLIYIANGGGTAWIELTSNGKIDIYAADSVSIHTEQDFNFRADRDINIEAGRNLNMSVGGNMQTDVVGNHTLLVSKNGFITYSGSLDHSVDSNATYSIGQSLHIGAGSDIFQTATQDHHTYAGRDSYISSTSKLNLKSGLDMYQQSGASFNVKATGNYLETAARIDMNGPTAASATQATASNFAAIPAALPKFKLPNRNKEAGWDDGKFYKDEDITSIMKRVPTHEPWDHHESINAAQFAAPQTDAEAGVAQTPGTVATPNRGPATSAAPNPPNYNRTDMPTDWTKDIAFYNKVKTVATELKCSYIDLLACMAFETGRTFNPGIQNSIGATGLIQFIRPTAIGLGTTTDQLRTMTRVEQMDWVLKYFKAGPIRKLSNVTLEDLYMAILWPAAVGKSNDYVLFSSPSKAYEQNKGLDLNKDGNITKAEAAAKVRNQLSYIRTQLLKIPDEGGVWKDSSGNTIKDGSGNPVKYGPYPPK
jgi:uncharacterized protein (DUF2345 family)